MENLFLQLRILLSFWNNFRKKEFGFPSKAVFDFERSLAKYLGAKHAITVASGTDALILSLKACGIGPEDEVIVPAIGFYSTAGAVSWINGRPVFVDVKLEDYNIDPEKIETVLTASTKAIIPVHLNGKMADMDAILAIAQKKGLRVIVDAAHAMGSRYKNRPIGAYGDLICLSFNPTKLFGTYGDGGAILTNDDFLAETLRRLRTYGAPSWREIHTNNTIIGTASRLGVLQAIVLNEKFPWWQKNLEKQRSDYYFYYNLLKKVPCLVLPQDQPDYFINGYRIVALTQKRDDLLGFLKIHGAKAYSFYPIPLPYLPVFKNLGYGNRDFPIADRIGRESVVFLPHYAGSQEEMARTSKLVAQFMTSCV